GSGRDASDSSGTNEGRGAAGRGAPAQAPPSGSAPSRDAGQPHVAPPAATAGAAYAVRSGVSRDRDPGAHEANPGGCARLSRAVAGAPGGILRLAAVAPDLQAAAHGVGLRPLLPAGALLPRRGPAQRPATRVHADRPRG